MNISPNASKFALVLLLLISQETRGEDSQEKINKRSTYYARSNAILLMTSLKFSSSWRETLALWIHRPLKKTQGQKRLESSIARVGGILKNKLISKGFLVHPIELSLTRKGDFSSNTNRRYKSLLNEFNIKMIVHWSSTYITPRLEDHDALFAISCTEFEMSVMQSTWTSPHKRSIFYRFKFQPSESEILGDNWLHSLEDRLERELPEYCFGPEERLVLKKISE